MIVLRSCQVRDETLPPARELPNDVCGVRPVLIETWFDEAVRLVKIPAANEGPDFSARWREAEIEGPSQTSKERNEAGTAHIDLNDLADATGVQANESDLRYILNALTKERNEGTVGEGVLGQE